MQLNHMLLRRMQGEPIAYIIGEQGFTTVFLQLLLYLNHDLKQKCWLICLYKK